MLTQGLTILVGRWAASLAWRSAHVPLLRLKVYLVPTRESGSPLPPPSGLWLSVLPTWLGGITKDPPGPATHGAGGTPARQPQTHTGTLPLAGFSEPPSR